ncbi:MAG: hypothetical protein OXU23_14390 [Candidatus Poribacteria bacterium]|nr:hypothetical protein [Candidatus Poribacteria bacterium]
MKYFLKVKLLFIILCLCLYGCGDAKPHASQLTRLLITDDEVEVTGIPAELQAYYETKWNAEALLAYYTKYIDAGGVAIVGNHYVEDAQFYAAREIVLHMTSKRPELREYLSFSEEYPFRITIINTEEPVDSEFNSEWGVSNRVNTIPEDADFWKLGWCISEHCVANVWWDAVYPPNRDGKINMRMVPFIHEFAHAIHFAIRELDPTFDERLIAALEYAKTPHEAGERAKSAWNSGLDPDHENFNRTHALTDYREYWAYTVVNWFHDPPSLNQHFYKTSKYDALLLPLIEEWLPKIYLLPIDFLERPATWDWNSPETDPNWWHQTYGDR